MDRINNSIQTNPTYLDSFGIYIVNPKISDTERKLRQQQLAGKRSNSHRAGELTLPTPLYIFSCLGY
jgi:hypothetical protein